MQTTLKHKSSNLTWALIAVLAGLILLQTQAIASGLGDYLSLKLLEREGVTNSRLTIAREGVTNPSLDMAMGPRVVTLAPTDVRMTDTTYATLRGEILSMNIDPSVTVWFECGYHPNHLNRIVGLQRVTSPGVYSVTITGQTPGPIYYRNEQSEIKIAKQRYNHRLMDNPRSSFYCRDYGKSWV